MVQEDNQAQDAALRACILPVVAATLDGQFITAGTCWVLAAAGKKAIGVTATHVLDWIVQMEGRHNRGVASLPPDFRSLAPRPIKLQMTRLYAIVQTGLDSMQLVDLPRIHRDGGHDLAIVELEVPAASKFEFRSKLAIASAPMTVGSQVEAVGYARHADTTVEEQSGYRIAKVYPQVESLPAHITETHMHRPGGPLGPCFDIDTEAPHGMSGGPILQTDLLPNVVVCGIVSRANSYGETGQTACSNLWPIYAMELDFLQDADGRPITLLEAANQGWIDDRSEPQKHFKKKPAPDGAGWMIGWT